MTEIEVLFVAHIIEIAVVDDQAYDREQISALLREYAASRRHAWQVRCFASDQAFLDTLTPGRYGMVFLDILMDGMDGMETARRFRATDPNTLLVLITTEASYAVEGYEVEAAGFLVKKSGTLKQHFDALMARLEQKIQEDIVLELPGSLAGIPVPASALLYAEVLNHVMKLCLKSGSYMVRMSLKELISLLPQDGRFFECHRGIVVNLDAVVSLDSQVATLSDGSTLPVSRRRRAELERAFAARSISKIRRELS